jgi:hypothetical protein
MKSTKKNADLADDGFKFEVGDMYENMKGDYQVISIQKDSMVIRWNDGSEIVTPMDLQKRIIDRMDYEKEIRQREAVAAREKTQKKATRKQ